MNNTRGGGCVGGGGGEGEKKHATKGARKA